MNNPINGGNLVGGDDRKVMYLKKDEVLVREGDMSHHLYWLQTGAVGVYKKKGNQAVLLGNVYSGELVGEMSFLDKKPRSATVIAAVDCEIIQIPAEKFEEYFNSQPKWYQALVKTLLERLRKANARVHI